jgi:hypothetical protein
MIEVIEVIKVIKVIEAARIKRDHRGPGAHSPNHEIAQSLSAAAAAALLAPLVGSLTATNARDSKTG